MVFESLALKMSRKKVFQTDLSESPLARVLTIFDLTALGVGSTLGLGVYVLSGSVSKEEAGPGIALSFVIAAIASLFAGLCYAEFGARVPRAGSAYIYSYVTVGEFIAFVIGWNLILEYVIGSASVVRGLTGYIDSLANNSIKHAFENVMPMNVDFLSPYPDFFAFCLTILFSVALALGVKESSRMNNIFTILNMAVVIFVIICGAIKADPNNWKIKKEDIPSSVENGGEGGFLPFGFIGLIKGAATCFYGFVGFDCIATTGEEAINPQRNIPLAIIISLTVIFLSYFGISSVLTMMIPYFYQDTAAPLAVAFDNVGWGFARWTVSIGAIFGLTASFMGALFPLPRIVYAMSTDGLLFRFMGKINPRFQTPLIGTLLSGTLTAFMALIFNLDQLVSMMSIGTLLAYSMVAACVMLLRYQLVDKNEGEGRSDAQYKMAEQVTFMNVMSQLLNLKKLSTPTKLSSNIATYLTALYFVFCIAAMAIVVQAADAINSVNPGAIFGLAFCGFLLLCSVISISLQPTSKEKLTFSVPLVPWVPAVSILINVYLMMMLDKDTWIRFAAWLFIGLIIYFGYGIHNSTGAGRKKEKPVENGTENHGFVTDDKL